MAARTDSQPKPPVGVIASLTLGFETIASNIGIILLPIALDLFLWLGPHLSINPIMQRFTALLAQVPMTDAASMENQRAMIDFFRLIGETTNVFTLLSTAPLGVPSLMVSQLPTVLPGGKPTVLFLDDELMFAALALAFSLVGLLLGAVYFNLIGWAVRDTKLSAAELTRRIFINWARLAAFSIVIGLIGAVASVPMLLVLGVMQIISPVLAGIGVSLWAALGLWFFIYIGFSLHGMVLQDRGVFRSMWESVRFVRANMFSVIGLFALIFLLNWGLGYVWSLPAVDSWLMLAGIGGHAFVSTGLVTATFVYYKDRYRWWNERRQQLMES